SGRGQADQHELSKKKAQSGRGQADQHEPTQPDPERAPADSKPNIVIRPFQLLPNTSTSPSPSVPLRISQHHQATTIHDPPPVAHLPHNERNENCSNSNLAQFSPILP